MSALMDRMATALQMHDDNASVRAGEKRKAWNGTFVRDETRAVLAEYEYDKSAIDQGAPANPLSVWSLVDRLLTDAYAAGVDAEPFDMLAARRRFDEACASARQARLAQDGGA